MPYVPAGDQLEKSPKTDKSTIWLAVRFSGEMNHTAIEDKPTSGKNSESGFYRGEKIRTSDLMVPNQISGLVETYGKRVDF